MHDTIWMIRPEALHAIAAKLQTLQITRADVDRYMEMIGQGPAEDAQRNGLPIRRTGSTALIPIMGPMSKGGGFFSWLMEWPRTDLLTQAVAAAANDPEIEQIMLLIDSPGGSVAGLSDLADAVTAAATIKPVIAQADGEIASAAYHIASQATEIYAGRMDMIGSIGTRMALYDYSAMFEADGVKVIPIDTGEFKSAGLPGTEVTDAQIAYFQSIVDGFFADFRQAVMSGRSLNAAEFKAVSDGRMFFAPDAENLGLIDGIRKPADTLQSFAPPSSRRRTAAAKRRLELLSAATR